jgi:hypothetical protein
VRPFSGALDMRSGRLSTLPSVLTIAASADNVRLRR